MKTTWIDLTDISIWSGHHTGTQRVVYQLAKRYHGKQNVKYFVFNPKHNTFHEHSFDGIFEQVEASHKPVEEHIKPAMSRKTQVKHMLIDVYKKTPESIRGKLTPTRRKQIKQTYKRFKLVILPEKQGYIIPTTPALKFSKDDTLLIMGKPWDYPSFIETLRKDKLDDHFKIIQIVYDLIPIFFPHLFGLPLFVPYVQHMFETAAISDGLLAISESSKRDMQKFCNDMLMPCPPIEVIRLGDDFAEAIPRKPGINLARGDYILCVGTVEVRKNHQLLYTTYKLGLSKGLKMPKLVIAGGKGWYTSDTLFAFAQDPQLKDLVYVMHHANDNELKWLYENCRFTVYPSVYEGWGLPIAESLAYGKLCISSNISSMPEIAGDLIDYFSPYDTAECLAAIQKYMSDTKLREKEEEIVKNYTMFSWDKTYEQVVRFVLEVSSKTPN